jgi:glycosyltransferase involved in cell wall biosynthesis
MKLAIVSDAWYPQVNGVVKTLTYTRDELLKLGHTVEMVTPDGFRTIPCPSYPEIRLSLWPARAVARRLEAFAPDAVHISTEGPLGLAARAWCVRNDFPFTTTFHTQFPEYVQLRTHLPLGVSYAFMRWFHNAGRCTMVATRTLQERLTKRGFTRLGLWSRGVDTALFRPRAKDALADARPISLYMGRVAVEKNIEAFLALELPGTKVVIGDGPDLRMLQQRYPAARFLGYKTGEDLARHVAAADVFVFPSRTDTFGLVLIEALACGVPVAALPVQGPIDVIDNGVTGILDEDLRAAALRALVLEPAACRTAALRYTWAVCTRQFLGHIDAARAAPAAAKIRQPASR